MPLYNQGMKAKLITGIVVLVISILIVGGFGGYIIGQSSKNQAVDQARQTGRSETLAELDREGSSNTKQAPAKTAPEATCNADELSLSTVNGSDSGAGTLTYDLILTNQGKRTCILGGFPGVSLVNDNGNQIGQPAARAANYVEKKLTLMPNAKVKAVLSTTGAGNYPDGTCKAGATKLRVYPPNDTGYLSDLAVIDAWCPGFMISPVLEM